MAPARATSSFPARTHKTQYRRRPPLCVVATWELRQLKLYDSDIPRKENATRAKDGWKTASKLLILCVSSFAGESNEGSDRCSGGVGNNFGRMRVANGAVELFHFTSMDGAEADAVQGVWDILGMPTGANVRIAFPAISARSCSTTEPTATDPERRLSVPNHRLLRDSARKRAVAEFPLSHRWVPYWSRRGIGVRQRRHSGQPSQISR